MPGWGFFIALIDIASIPKWFMTAVKVAEINAF
jgi:hypothetical protein